jgi:hypothetical protein
MPPGAWERLMCAPPTAVVSLSGSSLLGADAAGDGLVEQADELCDIHYHLTRDIG